MSKGEFVGNLTMEYTTDPEGFRETRRSGYKELIMLGDFNVDCLLEQDEFIREGFKNIGQNDTYAEMEYFNMFKEPQGIPLNEMIKVWFEFSTNEIERKHNNSVDIDII